MFQLKAIFDAFDADGSGKISLSELQSALEKGGKKVTTEECVDILLKVDQDADEEINFEEFEAVFQMAPDSLPVGLKELVDVSGFFMGSLGLAVGASVGLGVSGSNLIGASVGAGVGAMTGLFSKGEEAFDISDTNVANIGTKYTTQSEFKDADAILRNSTMAPTT